MKNAIAVEWKTTPAAGHIEVTNGTLAGVAVARGEGQAGDAAFTFGEGAGGRLEMIVEAAGLAPGKDPATVSILGGQNPFTFFVRDVGSEFPIVIPAYGVAVVPADDVRSYDQLLDAVRERDLHTGLEQIDAEPEESFEQAAVETRELKCPIWMGVSRDVRIFEMGLRQPMLHTDWIQPRFHGWGYFRDEFQGFGGKTPDLVQPRYGFTAGRGWACSEPVQQRLVDGMLPILTYERRDDAMRYATSACVTLERSPLTAEGVRGTHYLVADGLSMCCALTDEQRREYERLLDGEVNRDEETVLACRTTATNTGRAPCYAFFKAIFPHASWGNPEAHGFDGAQGFGIDSKSGQVFGVSHLDGQPLGQEEIAILLAPGESCTYDFFLPHRPIPAERAALLAERDVGKCLEQCRRFWQAKLDAAARLSLPEQRIDEMVQAGFLHLDLVNYGLEPDGVLNPSNGTYSGLGSETTRSILFFDSLGMHELARRCLDFFLEKQHADGFMQNFEGYMLETGAVLWCLGEHYRYTRDEVWLERIMPRVLKACEFITNWRAQSKGAGWGLLSGKVADPEDDCRTFMLNGYAYLGLKRAAEMLAAQNPARAEQLRSDAETFRRDIRAAFADTLARGPVIPLGDGTWCPTAGPWADQGGAMCLFADGKDWWTHGAMTLRDDILGPLHLVFMEVLDTDEPACELLLNYHERLLYSRNVSFSQPYYSSHPIIHLLRREPKRFLKAYYNMVASLADREMYTFWEHFYHESLHKIGDEGHFLLYTRWMLYIEDGDLLSLLRGIPAAWLADGKRIELNNACSYFGPFTLRVVSHVADGRIEAEIACAGDRGPGRVDIRLPHPQGLLATSVEGGEYDAASETVTVEWSRGQARVTLRFGEA